MALKYKELLFKLAERNTMFCDLKKAINDETLAVLQYMAGIGSCDSDDIKKEFDEHAKDEYRHAFMFHDILKDLGGYYAFNIQSMMMHNDCGFKQPFGISINTIMDNIRGEECAIISYERLLKSYEWNKKHKDMIQSIIDDEKEHRDDLFKLSKKKKIDSFEGKK